MSGNRVVGNCVRTTRGMRDQVFHGKFGQLLTNFWGRSLYLDDYTSHVEVTGNVFVDSSAYHVFFHSGSKNVVRNNDFVNATQCGDSTAGPQLLFKQITHGSGSAFPQHGNVLERNVIWTPRAVDEVRDERMVEHTWYHRAGPLWRVYICMCSHCAID